MEIKWNTIMKELTELKNREEMKKKWKIMELKNGKKTLIFFYWDRNYPLRKLLPS